MTLVVGWKFGSGIALIADCRVSYKGRPEVYDDLQKLYWIGDNSVLGFSGPLEGAYQVIEAIRGERTTTRLKDNCSIQDVERCVRIAFRGIQPKYKLNLKFILAHRNPTKVKEWGQYINTKFGLPNFPNCSIVLLKSSSSNPDELTRESQNINVIGDSTGMEKIIREKLVNEMLGVMMNPKGEGIVRVTDEIRQEVARVKNTVGGLFQCVVLDEHGIWWSAYSIGDLELKFEGERYVQVNKLTNKEIPLLTIWEWKKRGFERPLGEAVVFDA